MTSFNPLKNQLYQSYSSPSVRTEAVVDSIHSFLDRHPNSIHRRTILLSLLDAKISMEASCGEVRKAGQRVLEEYSGYLDKSTVGKQVVRAGCHPEWAEQLLEQSVATLRDTRRLEESDGYDYWWLGRARARLGRPDEAVRPLRTADSLVGREDRRVPLTLGENLIDAGRAEEAVPIYERLIDAYPNNETVRTALVGSYVETGLTPEEARSQAEKLAREAVEDVRSSFDSGSLTSKPTKPFTVKKADGGTLASEALQAPVTIITFAATWCTPCLAEMEFLEQLRQEYAEGALSVIGVAMPMPGTDQAYIGELRRKAGVSFPIVYGKEEVEEALDVQVRAIPRLFVLGPEGRLRASHRGYSRGGRLEERLRSEIEYLLSTGGSAASH